MLSLRPGISTKPLRPWARLPGEAPGALSRADDTDNDASTDASTKGVVVSTAAAVSTSFSPGGGGGSQDVGRFGREYVLITSDRINDNFA
jgi:hypothetical protein